MVIIYSMEFGFWSGRQMGSGAVIVNWVDSGLQRGSGVVTIDIIAHYNVIFWKKVA